jgi:hypothetical protein
MLTGCREYRKLLIELARGTVAAHERRRLLAHVEECADCARSFDGQLALSATMERMAGEAIPEMAAIESRVLAEFDRVTARRPVMRMSRWALVAGLAAAAFFGLLWVERRRPVPQPEQKIQTAVVQPPVPAPPVPPVRAARTAPRVQPVSQRATPPPSGEENQPFVTIPYTVPLAPEERTTVIRMEIPVAALMAAGFSVPASDLGGTVEADVLVSEDGRARAIRPISVSTSR